jgi:hypothetical protein
VRAHFEGTGISAEVATNCFDKLIQVAVLESAIPTMITAMALAAAAAGLAPRLAATTSPGCASGAAPGRARPCFESDKP